MIEKLLFYQTRIFLKNFQTFFFQTWNAHAHSLFIMSDSFLNIFVYSFLKTSPSFCMKEFFIKNGDDKQSLVARPFQGVPHTKFIFLSLLLSMNRWKVKNYHMTWFLEYFELICLWRTSIWTFVWLCGVSNQSIRLNCEFWKYHSDFSASFGVRQMPKPGLTTIDHYQLLSA